MIKPGLRYRRLISFAFVCLAVLSQIPSASTCYAGPEVCLEHLPGLHYSFYRLDEPRTVRIHVLSVDLSPETTRPAVVLAEKPPRQDRNAVRTDPRSLARHPELAAFVNTNPWTPWAPTYPTNVQIIGLAATGGEITSSHHGVSLWFDTAGTAYMGEPCPDADIAEGAGGFAQIIKDAQVIIGPDQSLAPRTAIGIDQTGLQMCFVVADGRQGDYSQGMTVYEMAVFMRNELGCFDAANMDGGGSSVLAIVDAQGQIRILNSPPGPSGYLRPLPTILTIRQKIPDE